MPFSFQRLDIPDVVLIEPKIFEDRRGFFMETYHYQDFEKAGIPQVFVQDNHSRSQKGVLRGLHFQIEPFAQGKLVRCVRGGIFDVAVDIRKESPTCGKWVAATLTEENRCILWIPRGFAHGYLSLQDGTEILYKTDQLYSTEHERGIRWNEPDLSIRWPLDDPIISDKDGRLPGLKDLV